MLKKKKTTASGKLVLVKSVRRTRSHRMKFCVQRGCLLYTSMCIRDSYPSANILVTTKKDFETHNRKKFCARIATGDYDAIIMGHSQFERIPISRELSLIHICIPDHRPAGTAAIAASDCRVGVPPGRDRARRAVPGGLHGRDLRHAPGVGGNLSGHQGDRVPVHALSLIHI